MKDNNTEVCLLVLKGAISELPAERREKVNACHEKLKSVVAEYGAEGLIAFAVYGVEIQLESEKEGG